MIIYEKKGVNKMMHDIFDDERTLNIWAKKMLDDVAGGLSRLKALLAPLGKQREQGAGLKNTPIGQTQK